MGALQLPVVMATSDDYEPLLYDCLENGGMFIIMISTFPALFCKFVKRWYNTGCNTGRDHEAGWPSEYSFGRLVKE